MVGMAHCVKKLYELVDIMIEIESLMANPQYTVLLSYFNSSSGVLPIINKLPYNIQEKWTMRAANLSSKRSQILATPHVGSELNEDLIVFACLPESGPSQRISKSSPLME
jgi:hypothetical protein